MLIIVFLLITPSFNNIPVDYVRLNPQIAKQGFKQTFDLL